MRGEANFCDFFVICSASSTKRVQAVGEAVQEKMDVAASQSRKRSAIKEEPWVLLDYGDVMVHIFHKEARTFYDLEYLWRDAPRLHLTFSHR